jgi:mRNA interferase RelE/StbE
MAWVIEFFADAGRELRKLDPPETCLILKFLRERLAPLDDPRSIGKALQGARLGEFWRYRVGPFRLLRKLEDHRLIVLVLQIDHRKEIYR